MSQKEINILFLGGAKRVSLAKKFISNGKKLDIQVNIHSYELEKNVPISQLAKVIIGLKWNNKDVISHLLDIINKYNISIIIPFVDPSISIAAELQSIINNIFIPVSKKKICDLFYDKIKSHDWLINNNFPVPEITSELPVIAKPRHGSASQGIVIIKKEREKKYNINCFNGDNYLVQKYIDGEEYTVDAYISRSNDILTIVPRKRLSVTSGEVTKAVTVRDNEIIKLSEQIINKAKLIGAINIQYILDSNTSKLYIMEINPRFGGGVILSIEAGADISLMLLKDYLGLPNEPVKDWKDQLLMLRYFEEYFCRADNN